MLARFFALFVCLASVLAAATPSSAQEVFDSSIPLSAAGRAAHALKMRLDWIRNHPNIPLPSGNPQITSGFISTPIVALHIPPAVPGVFFQFATGPTGLAWTEFDFVGPSGQNYAIYYFTFAAPTSGAVNRLGTTYRFNSYAEAGVYTLVSATIADYVGNTTTYNPDQLAKIFPKLTFYLSNIGDSDSAKPQLLSGKITPTVSLSSPRPVFAADLIVSDSLSGVGGASLILASPDGQIYTQAWGQPGTPIQLPAKLTAAANFIYETNFPRGTWTIIDVSISDIAGNTLDISDANQIKSLLGSNTFQLTD